MLAHPTKGVTKYQLVHLLLILHKYILNTHHFNVLIYLH